MGRVLNNEFISFLIISLLTSVTAFAANEAPQTIPFHGTLYRNQAYTDPLLDAAATINIQVLDPSKSCVLYEETQVVDTTGTAGKVNLQVGSSVSDAKRTGDDPNHPMANILQNISDISAINATCGGGTYSPSSGDVRYVRVTLTPSATGIPITLSPDMTLSSIPNALVCETIQGIDKTKLVELNATPNAGEDGQTIRWNNSLQKFEFFTAGTGDIESVIAGTGLTGGATSGAATLNVDVGTAASKIVQLDGSARLPAVDGSQLTNLPGAAGDIESVVAGTGLTGGATSGAATLNVDVGTTASKIVQLDGSARLPAVDGSQLTNLPGAAGDIESVVAGTGLTGGATSGAATLNVDVGTTANKIVQLDGSARLPAVDGSQLTGVSGTDSSKVSKSGDTMTGTLNLPANGLVAGTTQLVLSGGDVGIGTASPAQKLDVNGNIVATAMYYTSDRRLKKDIEDISGLEHLLRMRGVRFTWIKDGRPDVGLIAQEVEKVFPELVHTNPKTGKKSVQYGNLVAPLIEATKEMVDMIEENQRDIASLKEENQQIKADLETLKAAIESLK